MEISSKLILIEGICGSGKSTLAERMHGYLSANGCSVHFFDEGAKNHPASLNWHAYVTRAEYNKLLADYPKEADTIREVSVMDDNDILIPYRNIKAFESNLELYGCLKEHELCWNDKPVVTLPEYSQVIQRHWTRFARSIINEESIIILEGVFFQHPIHDLIRIFQADEARIEAHIRSVADRIMTANPILIYLSQPNVREQQERIARLRSKPHFGKEANIQRMEYRKKIEIRLISQMPFRVHIIENEHLEWDDVFSRMVDIVTGGSGM